MMTDNNHDITRFPPPLAQAGSVTSHLAAESVRRHAPNQRKRILFFMGGSGLKTRDEIMAGVQFPLASVTARVSELIASGHLKEIDHLGISNAGKRCGRVMRTGKVYSEVPLPPAEHQRELPLSALPASSATGQEAAEVSSPSGIDREISTSRNEWAELEADVAAAGVQLGGKAVATAREAGVAVGEVRAALRHFAQLNGVGPASLYRKISQLRPGEPVTSNWPHVALEKQFAALTPVEHDELRERLFTRLEFLRERFEKNAADVWVAEGLLEQYRRELAARTDEERI